jgi:hypothetical protein
MGAHPDLAPLYETHFLRKVLRHCEKTTRFWERLRSSRSFALFPESLSRFYFTIQGQRVQKSIIATVERLPDTSTIKQEYEKFPFGLAHCILFKPDEMARETNFWLEALQAAYRSEDDVYRLTREYIDRLFAIHCQRLNKPYWVNKTPALLNYLDRLYQLYPSARCIHMIRDGRSCAASLVSLPWGPKTIREAARHWKQHLLNGRLKAKRVNLKYIELRYEDLIESPQEVLARAFSFVGVPADTDSMLPTLPLYKTRLRSWQSSFTPEDRQVFAREAGDLLIELGYEKDDRWVEHQGESKSRPSL